MKGPRLVPGSPEYCRAWELDPAAIARSLTPEERADPELNPLHPLAPSVAPGTPLRNVRALDGRVIQVGRFT